MRTLQLERRILNVRALPKPIPFQMGLQVPYCVCTQATAQSHFRTDAPSSGRDFPCVSPAKVVPDYRRASDAGPCAYVYRDSPQAASVIGFLKGKSAIAIARLCGKERNFSGEHLWARGYAVSTVGFELEQVRQYIRDQEAADGTNGQF